MQCYGLPLLKSGVAKTADEAAKLAESFAAAVAMKVMSEDVVHKFDAGGVLLNIRGAEEARAGLRQDHRERRKGRARGRKSRGSSSSRWPPRASR